MFKCNAVACIFVRKKILTNSLMYCFQVSTIYLAAEMKFDQSRSNIIVVGIKSEASKDNGQARIKLPFFPLPLNIPHNRFLTFSDMLIVFYSGHALHTSVCFCLILRSSAKKERKKKRNTITSIG
jgi:hypothetical protein